VTARRRLICYRAGKYAQREQLLADVDRVVSAVADRITACERPEMDTRGER
jgi:hypothetical protein